MKKYLYGILLTSAVMATGCSETYLDLTPESTQTPGTIFSTVDNAKYAVNGLGRLMTEQYMSTQGCSGEGTMIVGHGEFPGYDMIHNRWNTTWYNRANFNNLLQSEHDAARYPWLYNYKMIANANEIINNIDAAELGEGGEAERDFVKAQALCYRANAYLWLVQCYSKRWCDSNNGASRGVILRTGSEPDDIECSTLAECYEFIYNDLNNAIALFQSSGMDRPSGSDNIWQPNEQVAHAIYARAALVREDWSTANTQAELASKGFSLMSSDEYREGFNYPNKEWIWMIYNDNTQTLSYYGPFAYLASNATGTVTRSYGNTINKELSDQIPAEDTRLWLYGIPQEGDNNTINTTTKPGNVTKGDLYNRYLDEYYDRYCHSSAMTYYAYAVMKFLGTGSGNDGCFVLFRAAEMYYTRAEALYEMGGHEAEARNLLIEAVKPYQPNYTCNLSGTALRDEIRLYRRFDLLGEGHSWFDFKRWKLPMVRVSWADGGNWPAVFCGDGTNGGSGGNYGVNDKNNWCVVIPDEELYYNNYVKYAEEPANWTKGYESK